MLHREQGGDGGDGREREREREREMSDLCVAEFSSAIPPSRPACPRSLPAPDLTIRVPARCTDIASSAGRTARLGSDAARDQPSRHHRRCLSCPSQPSRKLELEVWLMCSCCCCSPAAVWLAVVLGWWRASGALWVRGGRPWSVMMMGGEVSLSLRWSDAPAHPSLPPSLPLRHPTGTVSGVEEQRVGGEGKVTTAGRHPPPPAASSPLLQRSVSVRVRLSHPICGGRRLPSPPSTPPFDSLPTRHSSQVAESLPLV